MMLSVASQSSVAPYWAVTAGPVSHSPEPIEAPASNTPGPITLSHRRQPRPGGNGKSPTVYGGSTPAWMCSVFSPVSGGDSVAIGRSSGKGIQDAFRLRCVGGGCPGTPDATQRNNGPA